jgi:hypothetical protein
MQCLEVALSFSLPFPCPRQRLSLVLGERKESAFIEKQIVWVPMAHACNPCYSGGFWFEASLGK